MPPVKRGCKKTAYDGLFMCDVDVRMHQSGEWSLSTQDMLKEQRDD